MRKIKTLKKNYQFRKTLTKGKYYKGQVIDIYIRQNKQIDNYIGIAVSVKVGKAVKRNHIKRLIRENYKQIKDKLEKGYDIVFLWKKQKSFSEATYDTIKKDEETIFKKAELLKEVEK